MTSTNGWSTAGLFAGVGGIELGLHRAGFRSALLVECWEPAQAVLETRFPGVPVVDDVRKLEKLPPVDLVAAGFPCTDLSQAGRTHGISGDASGLVSEVFRLVDDYRAPWILFENVRNMLVLDQGLAMRYLVDQLEQLGYRWAYRLVDSRFTGVPQRRQRVIMLASLDGDPCEVLFADDAGQPTADHFCDDVAGFYWTEGLRGLGWAQDAVPTLKGGSTVGIPSPPAIWNPGACSGRRIVTPSIDEAEAMQGFARGWTAAAKTASLREGTRWKLVGNAVTVGVSEWVGGRLIRPGAVRCEFRRIDAGDRWPPAAWGCAGLRWAVDASMWPVVRTYRHLATAVDLANAAPLSLRATTGFHERATRSRLHFRQGFLDDIADHIKTMKES